MRRLTPRSVLTVAVLAPLLLSGCGGVQDAANTAASNGATQARNDASNKIKEETQKQAVKTVCQLVNGSGPLKDGAVSDNDRVVVASAETLATSVDLPTSFTAALKVLASTDSSKQAQTTAIAQLRKACP